MLLRNYQINEQTVLLTGIYGRYNHLQTMIIAGNKTYRVNGSTEQIIEKALKKEDSSFRRALANARAYLGNLKMYPIKINSQQGLYFFPSKSPKKPDCVWFSLVHVKGAKLFGKNKTKVYLSYGHSIIIDCKLSTFQNKLRRTQELRRKVVENEHCPFTFFLEPKKSLQKQKETKIDTSLLNDDQKDISSGQNES